MLEFYHKYQRGSVGPDNTSFEGQGLFRTAQNSKLTVRAKLQGQLLLDGESRADHRVAPAIRSKRRARQNPPPVKLRSKTTVLYNITVRANQRSAASTPSSRRYLTRKGL